VSIFQKIIDKEIPADIVYEDPDVLGFRDINPQAPTHILVIPKRPLAGLGDMGSGDIDLIGKLMYRAAQIAEQEGLADYRLVINNGAGAGQTVFHLHVHILGGRYFSWPPG